MFAGVFVGAGHGGEVRDVLAFFSDVAASVFDETFHRAVNVVRPGTIRVNADEMSYHLHILLRYELEIALLSGDLPVSELRAAWKERSAALIGMIFWGIGMAAQGSLIQAMLTGVIPPQKRSTAFGLFDTGYGIAWFVGSAVMGLLYDKSILAVAIFSVSLQLAALPVFFIANKKR